MLRTCLAPLLLCAALLGWAPSAFALGNCNSDAYVRSFDARLGGTRCVPLVETAVVWAGGRQPLRLVTSEESAGEPTLEYLVAPIRSLAERAGRAMNEMGGVEIPPVTIFLTSLPPPPELGADEPTAALARPFPDECEVVFYWSPEGESYDSLMFTLAHELFHCISAKSFLSVYNHESAIWWSEGSAEYFAHLAYPGTSFSDGEVAEFDAGSPTQPLWSFTYSSAPFFFWLGQNEGPNAVSRLVHGLATGEGAAAEHAALRRMVSAEQWKRFGEAYLDGKIRQPGGRLMASTPLPGALRRITGPTTHRVASQPFVLHRERLSFARGKLYTLQQTHIDAGLSVAFSNTPGVWIAPPDNVTACREDVVYRVLATTTDASGAAGYQIGQPPGMQNEGACCLVGEWSPTPASREGEVAMLAEVGAGRIAAVGGSLSCEPPEGTWLLSFAADGTGSVDWQGFANRCITRAQGGKMETTSVRNGTTGFEWSTIGPGAGTARYVENTVEMTINMTLGPMTVLDRTAPDAGPATESNGFAYQCTVDTLTVQGIYGLNYRQAEYTRVSEPAP